MVEIPVERKSSKNWLWLLLPLLLLALLLWWVLDDNDSQDVGNENEVADIGAGTQSGVSEDQPAGPQAGEGVTAAGAGDAAGSGAQGAGGADGSVNFASVAANPQAYVGRDGFSADNVTVPAGATMTDRGFWMESQGQRLFAILIDNPREVPIDINPGQQLRISGGRVRDGSSLDQLPGAALDSNTRSILSDQTAFVLVDEENIEILSRP